jgi:hypothetical protein
MTVLTSQKLDLNVHAPVQNTDNLNLAAALFAIKNNVAAGVHFSVTLGISLQSFPMRASGDAFMIKQINQTVKALTDFFFY